MLQLGPRSLMRKRAGLLGGWIPCLAPPVGLLQSKLPGTLEGDREEREEISF